MQSRLIVPQAKACLAGKLLGAENMQYIFAWQMKKFSKRIAK
jgi:hypothetical protein